MAILFIILEKPNNYAFGHNLIATPPPQFQDDRSLSYKNCPLFMYDACYWEERIHFTVGRQIFCCFFPGENFPRGGKFPGGEIVRGNCLLGKFSNIPIQNYSYISCFLFSVSILRVV